MTSSLCDASLTSHDVMTTDFDEILTSYSVHLSEDSLEISDQSDLKVINVSAV